MKKNKTIIFIILFTLIPILWGSLIYDKLPNYIPTHFDFNGNPNKFNTKFFTIYIIPIIMASTSLIMYIFNSISPKRVNKNNKAFLITISIIPIICNLTILLSVLVALEFNINVSKISILILSIVFIVLGNYLPKITQNYTIGIKLPWTLNSNINWTKTHKIAGICFIIVGFSGILFSIFNLPLYLLLFIFFIFSTIIPTVYSFLLYYLKKD